MHRSLDDAEPCRTRLEHSRTKSQGGLSIGCMCPRSMMRDRWCIDDYTIGKRLHEGPTSLVFKATCKRSGTPVAIKVYNKNKLHVVNFSQVKREIDLHSRLSHPNIITLYGAFESESHYFLVQEFADGGDLFDEMRSRRGLMTEKEVVGAVVLPLLDTLVYCHSQGIIHRDIKPENVLFTEDMILKLADFGLAINQNEERPVTRAGTLEYMPPEVLKNPGKQTPSCNKERLDLVYDAKVDLWAMAVMVYELLYGFPTFGKSCTKTTTKRILSVDPQFHPDVRDLSQDAADFLQTCLCKKPDKRCTAREVLGHSWIQSLFYGSVPGRRSMSTPRAPVAVSASSLKPSRASTCDMSRPLDDSARQTSTALAASVKMDRPLEYRVSTCTQITFGRRNRTDSKADKLANDASHVMDSFANSQPRSKPSPDTIPATHSAAAPMLPWQESAPLATQQGNALLRHKRTLVGALPWQQAETSKTAGTSWRGRTHGSQLQDASVGIPPSHPAGTVSELKEAIAKARRHRSSRRSLDPGAIPRMRDTPSDQSSAAGSQVKAFDVASVLQSLKGPGFCFASQNQSTPRAKLGGRRGHSLDLPAMPFAQPGSARGDED